MLPNIYFLEPVWKCDQFCVFSLGTFVGKKLGARYWNYSFRDRILCKTFHSFRFAGSQIKVLPDWCYGGNEPTFIPSRNLPSWKFLSWTSEKVMRDKSFVIGISDIEISITSNWYVAVNSKKISLLKKCTVIILEILMIDVIYPLKVLWENVPFLQ